MQPESTFITKGADCPTVTCDNWYYYDLLISVFSSREIDRKNIDLHMVYCLKNITKCPYCKLQVDIKDLPTHIEEAASKKDELAAAVLANNLELIKSVQIHGGDL